MTTYKPKKPSVIEMYKEDKGKVIFRFFVALLFLLLLVLFVASVFRAINEKDCYDERHTFLSDRIDTNKLCDDEECLFMRTIDLDNSKERNLFFANEKTLFSDKHFVSKGDILIIRWCPTEVGDRIRRVKKE